MSFRRTFLALGFLSAAVSVLPAALSAALSASRPLVFRNARVFDGTRLIPKADVLVRDGRIEAGGPNIAIPEGAQGIDGSGKTLLPGLIDANAHVWTRDMVKQQHMFGVTEVLDMFTEVHFAAGMRNEQSAGRASDRADLYSAGTLITAPGGHGTEYGIKIPTLSDPTDAQAFVDARIHERLRVHGIAQRRDLDAVLCAMPARRRDQGARRIQIRPIRSSARALLIAHSGREMHLGEHVEHRRHAEHELLLEHVPSPDVRVRVDESRQQSLAAAVDYLSAFRDSDVRPPGFDAPVAHQHIGLGNQPRAVEHARIAKHQRPACGQSGEQSCGQNRNGCTPKSQRKKSSTE